MVDEKDLDESDSNPSEDSAPEVDKTSEDKDLAGAQASEEEAPAEKSTSAPASEELDLPAVDAAGVAGVAALFEHPDHLLYAATQTRDSDYKEFEAYSPFPIHGMDAAMGLGRSWIPWVCFGAGVAGFLTANILQFGVMVYDWPMNFGGKPFAAWPSFVPIIFELTVLFAGVTTALVMLKAAGCFKKPLIVAPEITTDRFVLWISSEDAAFERSAVVDFMRDLNPSEIRTVTRDQ
jgi:hypothetical protein